MDGRRTLIIASNRLPIAAVASADKTTIVPSTGGLASGLRSLHARGDSIWIGSQGDVSGLSRRARTALGRVWDEHRIVPVALSRSECTQFADAFCNGVLWPVLHYAIDRMAPAPDAWDVYRRINERFAAAIVAHYRPGDVIWIHDYHLLLAPALVRFRLPAAPIGFFLHVPFPAPDVFRVLPWTRSILEGMLGATLLGFQTDTYAAHFVEAVRMLSVHPVKGRRVAAGDRQAHVGTYPIGVDAASFASLASDPAVARLIDTLRAGEAPRLLVGIDRLDYTKGIPLRLLAFERLLTEHPELRGRVQLIQVAVPTRAGVLSYQDLRHEVEALAGRINGRLGTMTWTPIRYLHQSVTPEELVALYRAADVMLVTPLRDGMNLVAKEFVAARTDGDGALILSEFAGAARELPHALLVNPFDVEETARAMHRALFVDAAERQRRMAALRRQVLTYDRDWWAASFLADLASTADVPAAGDASAWLRTPSHHEARVQ
jgi:trehalose 6-phosphate synthase/phosphatase